MPHVNLSDSEWRQKLTPEQFEILRLKATEEPFSGKFADNHQKGVYSCIACGKPLFSSETKFDSGTGWPSFYDIASKGNVTLHVDDTYRSRRMEVSCARCGGHLGHVFDDGPADKGGKRYCINSACLNFKVKK